MKTNRKPNRGGKNNGNSRGNGDKIAKYILVAVGALLLIWAGKTVYDKFSSKDVVTAATALVTPVQPDGNDVNALIVLDCSSSMKGYANAYPNNYIDVLSDLLSLYPNTDALINDTTVKGRDLIDKIRNHEIEYTQQSLIDQDLADLAEKVQEALNPKDSTASKNKTTANGAVKPLYFYITDGIMSGSDEQIKNDQKRQYNLIHAQDLKNQVRNAFEGKDSVGVSVYQFKSRFKGEYWAYDNEHRVIDSDRYFYVIAVGPRPALADLKQKVDSKQKDPTFCFRTSAQWHAIDDNIISSDLNVGPAGTINQVGVNCTYSPKTLNASNNGMIDFSLNANVLSNYYLENVKDIAKSAEVEVNGKLQKDIVRWDSVANAFKFQIPIGLLSGKGDNVKFSIPRQSNLKWIEKSAINPKTGDADKYMFSAPDPRTFLLRELMDGLLEGVHGAKKDYIYQSTVLLDRGKN